MNLEITEKNKKPLLDREELVGTLTFEGATPSRKEVRKEIANQTKAKEDMVIVKDIYNVYGELKAEVSAYVYSSADALKKIELPWVLKRHEAKKAEGGEEAPAEAAPEAKPAEGSEEPKEKAPAEETPKEEVPAEEKKEEKSAEGE